MHMKIKRSERERERERESERERRPTRGVLKKSCSGNLIYLLSYIVKILITTKTK